MIFENIDGEFTINLGKLEIACVEEQVNPDLTRREKKLLKKMERKNYDKIKEENYQKMDYILKLSRGFYTVGYNQICYKEKYCFYTVLYAYPLEGKIIKFLRTGVSKKHPKDDWDYCNAVDLAQCRAERLVRKDMEGFLLSLTREN